MADDPTENAPPPATIGPPALRLRVPGSAGTDAALGPRLARAVVVGLMFSVVPVLLTHLVLVGDEGGFDPRSFGAAVPVLLVAGWLSRPRDRWYAVGPRGFAQGERFFGQIRWDAFLFDDIERVEITGHRAARGDGATRFTGYRFVFEGKKKMRVVVEGDVEEPEPRGPDIRLPDDADLPETHELRALRAAVRAWERATRRKAEAAGVVL